MIHPTIKLIGMLSMLSMVAFMSSGDIPYDSEGPAMYKPRLIKPEHNYQAGEWDSYAVYGDLPIIKEDFRNPSYTQDPHGNMAIWRTKNATYLATSFRLAGVRTWCLCSDTMFLRDSRSGKKYPITEVMGFPFNHYFIIEGVSGDQVYIIAKFPPLPKSIRFIDFCEPDGNLEHRYLNVEELEANHHRYVPVDRKIVY